MFYTDRRFLAGIIAVLSALSVLYFFLAPDLPSEIVETLSGRDASLGEEEEETGPEECPTCGSGETAEGDWEEKEDSGEGGGGGGGGSGGSELGPQGCEAHTGNKRDWCYRDLALEQGDHTICLNIVDDYNRDSCYRYLAMDLDDPSLCDYIEDEFRREWCHELLD